MDFSEYGTTFLVPGSVFSVSPGSRVSTIVYRTLHNVFRLGVEGSSKVQNRGGSLEKTGSSIISATVIPRPTSPLRNPVKLVFNRNNKVFER